MSARRMRCCLLFCIVAVMSWAPSPSTGQYELSWYTIDAGGGASAGGPYTLTGTIGQPDAGAMAGGDFELLAGFWPGDPLCIVQFDDFARFAELWLISDPAADLDGDTNIDLRDLDFFADFWLSGCPHAWPLK